MNKPTTNILHEMESFFTRQAGNDGVEMPLFDPATGKKTAHWLRIRSIDSDTYSKSNSKAMQDTRALMEAKPNDLEKSARLEDIKLELISSLVSAWSFPLPCTLENVKRFFTEAPQIREAVNHAAGNRSLFLAACSKSSEPTQKPTSSSAKRQKAPKQQKGNS